MKSDYPKKILGFRSQIGKEKKSSNEETNIYIYFFLYNIKMQELKNIKNIKKLIKPDQYNILVLDVGK